MDRILWVLRSGLTGGCLALVLIAAMGQRLAAAEPLGLTRPKLATPVQTLRRLDPDDNPAAASLAEIPATEPWPATDHADVEAEAEAAAPTASPLAIVETVQVRSEQLEQVAQQADRKTRHGCDLAGRGARLAARAEFIGALRLMAEGLDTEQKTDAHSRALAAALCALEEAEDFLPGGSRLEADMDLSGIIAGHATPVLKDYNEKRNFADGPSLLSDVRPGAVRRGGRA